MIKIDLKGHIHSFVDRPALIESLKLNSNRDPFDRIIVATAQAYKLKLLTKDLRILKTFPKLAIW